MQKIKWKKQKFSIILIVISLYFLVRAFLLPVQFSSVALVQFVGIDKLDNTYLVSMQIITPKFETGVTKNLEVNTSSGASIEECFKNSVISLGKELGFSHMSGVVLSSALLEEETLFDLLHPILKNHSTNNNSPIFVTEGLAVDVLQANNQEASIYDTAKNLSMKKNVALLKNVKQERQFASSLMFPIISVKEQVSISEVKNENESAPILQNSNKRVQFDGNWLLQTNKNLSFVTSEMFENLSLIKQAKNMTLPTKNKLGQDVTLLNATTKIIPSFYNNVPRLHLKVNLKVEEGAVKIDLQMLKQEMINEVRKKLANALLFIKQNQANLFFVFEHFEAFEQKNWANYLAKNEQNWASKLEVFAEFCVKFKNKISLA
jgi:hypothetical protein